MNSKLLEKYDVPTPGYESYPAVSYWGGEPPSEESWSVRVLHAFQGSPEISVGIHLPFCKKTGANGNCIQLINGNPVLETSYINTLLQEWKLYTTLLPGKPVLRELFLDGAPASFSPEDLHRLVEGILAGVEVAREHEFGFKAHPASTTREHMQVLAELGFNAIRIEVQAFEPELLRALNSHHSFDAVHRVTLQARRLDYRTIHYNLLFSLPMQTKSHIWEMARKVRILLPGRITFRSYAPAPGKKLGQQISDAAGLPSGKEKWELYWLGRELLEKAGYVEAGLGVFALPPDKLYRAIETGSLHRNFMGYSPFYTALSIGLGASANSDSGDAYIRNEYRLEAYQEKVANGHFPFDKGHLLTREDQILRGHILNILCRYETIWYLPDYQCKALFEGLERLQPLEADGLLRRYPFQLKVTSRGRPFLRNICLALDARYWRKQPSGQMFSQMV